METTQKDLFERLMRLQWLLHRQRMQRGGHGPMGDPSRGQGRVLAALKLQPEIPTKDLSFILGIRQQSLNELLNKLEKGGYIERVPSEADRRVMLVKLTEKGEKERQEPEEIPDIFDCLDENEQALLLGYLERMIERLEEGMDDRDDETWENWTREARGRFGDERFEAMMAMRGGPRHGGRGKGCGRGRQGEVHGHDMHGHEMHGHERRERHGEDCHRGEGHRGGFPFEGRWASS